MLQSMGSLDTTEQLNWTSDWTTTMTELILILKDWIKNHWRSCIKGRIIQFCSTHRILSDCLFLRVYELLLLNMLFIFCHHTFITFSIAWESTILEKCGGQINHQKHKMLVLWSPWNFLYIKIKWKSRIHMIQIVGR